MKRRSNWGGSNEFGLLLGLVAILSFFAIPLFQNMGGAPGLASAGSQTGVQLNLTGKAGHHSQKGGAINTLDIMNDSATGHAVNATSVDGFTWGKAANETSKKANEIGKIAQQLNSGANANPALANMVATLAQEAGGLARSERAITSNCKSGGSCGASAGMKRNQESFEKQMQRLMDYIAAHPDSLSPELKELLTSSASDIANLGSQLENIQVADGGDLDKIAQEIFNRCANADDRDACMRKAALEAVHHRQ